MKKLLLVFGFCLPVLAVSFFSFTPVPHYGCTSCDIDYSYYTTYSDELQAYIFVVEFWFDWEHDDQLCNDSTAKWASVSLVGGTSQPYVAPGNHGLDRVWCYAVFPPSYTLKWDANCVCEQGVETDSGEAELPD